MRFSHRVQIAIPTPSLVARAVRVRSKHSDLNIRTIRMEGRPSANIVDVAEKEGYDLIAMESRGIGGIEGRIFGSTSRRVVDSCKKPVLIIKLSRAIVGATSHGFGF